MDAILLLAGSAVLLYASWSYLSGCSHVARVKPVLFALIAMAGAMVAYFLAARLGVCKFIVQNSKVMNLILAAAMVAGGFYVSHEVSPCTDWLHANLIWLGGAGILGATVLPMLTNK